ncbi:MAG TPA: PQQ-dependent sugar dehydrogenase [Jatrophihabitans sp.]|jgi:glucose/arabinose dehydrogenase|uniref:PQQ-dependent sugar dehydrogenase n=1 Tax=Jatrophihabitans sp. TaxID=1932789 RepID=UPI002E0C1B14|nr:PQQ-dependent sugar dehydrogenase [Jatrophihabitans sp.]
MRPARSRGLLVGGLAVLLAGCSSAAGSDVPNWQASPSGPGIEGNNGAHLTPILPIPSLPGDTGGPGGPPPSSSGPSSSKPVTQDPLVVATHLSAPVGLTLLADGSALVGERTTGRIVRVQPQPGRPVPTVRTLPGLDTSGDGGLLDLAISPTYDQDNLIYAYVTTPKDNRVVDFTLSGPVTPVLTGIPKGRTGNTGRLLFGPDGSLYVGTGDAGTPSAAANPTSLAGKVLRVDDIGQPASGNPNPSSPVLTTGQHVVDGLCRDAGGSTVLEAETGAPGYPDEINVISPGDYYGWPTPNGIEHDPVATLPPTGRGPGGCAVLKSRLWVTSLDGRSVLSAALGGAGDTLQVGSFTPALTNRYGRLRTIVAAPDGALWVTTSNRDGKGKPVPDDERVIRFVPSGSEGGGGRIV